MTMTNGGGAAEHDSKRRSAVRDADEFETHRRHLTGLAYRMLGSMAEAEDAVQETYIRWHRTDQAAIASVRAFLSKTVTRICLDQMKSARARHGDLQTIAFEIADGEITAIYAVRNPDKLRRTAAMLETKH